VYRLESALEPLTEEEMESAVAVQAEKHHIEGKLEDYIVVSVPETTSYEMAEDIKNRVMAVVKRPVCVISHNVSVLRAVKLTPKEAAEVIKKGEDYAEQQLAQAQHAGDGDGSGPGLRVVGSGDSGASTNGGSESPDGGRDGNQEGGQENTPDTPRGE
jgi:hypothetical protein